MASIAMRSIAYRIIRLRWLSALRRRPGRRRRPRIGTLGNHLRRDVGLGPDPGA